MRLHAPLVALVVLGLFGCHGAQTRSVREPEEVEAGTVLTFGSPAATLLTWDFGDGSPKLSGAEVHHAFSRRGRYSVVGSDGQHPVQQQAFTVVPRRVLRAIPLHASSAVVLPKMAGHLEPMVDFLDQLFGPDAAQGFLEQTVLPGLAIDLSASNPQAVEGEEGLGLFTLPQFDGMVGLLGVADGPRALAGLGVLLERKGGIGRSFPDGSLRMVLPDQRPVLAVVDRGYLYLAIAEKLAEGEPDRPARDPAVVLEEITRAAPPGLEAVEGLTVAQARLAPGDLYLFLGRPPAEGSQRFGVFASVELAKLGLKVDGIVHSPSPLWLPGEAVAPPLFKAAAANPVFAAYGSVPPHLFAEAAVGPPGSDRHRAAATRIGLDDRGLETLISSLQGDFSALLYFDAEAFLRNLISGTGKPDAKGGLEAELGLSRLAPFQQWLAAQLGNGTKPLKAGPGGGVRYRWQIRDVPVELQVGEGRALLSGGTGVSQRPRGDLGQSLRARFGGAAFSPGHLSVMLDLAQLRRELEKPRALPGVDSERVVSLQGFASQFLKQLTPVEELFLDLGPDPLGGRIQGRLTMRPRTP